jgi:exonuclease SbcC
MFSTKKEDAKIEYGAEEKQNSLNELSSLGKIKEDLKKEISRLEGKSLEYRDIDEKVIDKEVALKNLDYQLLDKKHVITLLDEANIKFKELSLKNDELESSIKLSEENKKVLLSDYKKLSKDYNTNSEKFNKDIVVLKDLISSKNIELETIKENFIVNSLNYEKVINGLKKEILDNSNNLSIIIEKINDLNSKKLSLENDIIVVENYITESEKNADNIISEANKYYDEKVKEGDGYFLSVKESIVKKEGAISDREAWVNSKEKELIELKSTMEEFHGKKINRINL